MAIGFRFVPRKQERVRCPGDLMRYVVTLADNTSLSAARISQGRHLFTIRRGLYGAARHGREGALSITIAGTVTGIRTNCLRKQLDVRSAK